ncbi:MAG: hypothetical protein BYD32DRAFT_280861 [Podila humilis]|nr:MAG: hypothetical protein BYD32DRAFT_280861 [Podila humilis]
MLPLGNWNNSMYVCVCVCVCFILLWTRGKESGCMTLPFLFVSYSQFHPSTGACGFLSFHFMWDSIASDKDNGRSPCRAETLVPRPIRNDASKGPQGQGDNSFSPSINFLIWERSHFGSLFCISFTYPTGVRWCKWTKHRVRVRFRVRNRDTVSTG